LLGIQVIFLGWVIYSGVSALQNGLGLQIGLWAVTFVITCAIPLNFQLPRRRACSVRAGCWTRGRCPPLRMAELARRMVTLRSARL
jgi:hypothetical protein